MGSITRITWMSGRPLIGMSGQLKDLWPYFVDGPPDNPTMTGHIESQASVSVDLPDSGWASWS